MRSHTLAKEAGDKGLLSDVMPYKVPGESADSLVLFSWLSFMVFQGLFPLCAVMSLNRTLSLLVMYMYNHFYWWQ